MIQAIVFLPLLGAILAGLIAIFGAHARNPSGDQMEHGHDDHAAVAHDDHGHDDHSSDIKDVTVGEWIAWTPFLLAIVVFGVYPQLMFKIIDPAVQVALKAFGG